MAARLVAIGDSIVQGFQHGAIRRPAWSFPALVARVLGTELRQADFSGDGVGGPLCDLELLLRELDRSIGGELAWWRAPQALLAARAWMDRVEGYWERGAGTRPSATGPIHHNLAVWGFEVLDALTLDSATCRRHTPPPTDDLIAQLPEQAMYRTAGWVLNPSQDPRYDAFTQLDAAQAIAERDGIENLVVSLGANNALATCLFLELRWSTAAALGRLAHERGCTVWRPEHFATLYDRLAQRIDGIGAERVFVATVPHVTVAPVCRGVSSSPGEQQDGYFDYYTHFWIWDEAFDPATHPHLTRAEAQAVDSAIDAYNDHIRRLATTRGWHVLDHCAVLDAVAFRRASGQPRYRFPAGLVAALAGNPATSFRVRPDGTVLLDTRYFCAPQSPPPGASAAPVWQGCYRGGLFGLDGIHPTTIGYGIVAHEALTVMRDAGVAGADPEALDWNAIVAADTLVTEPPLVMQELRDLLGFLFGPLQLHRLIQHLSGLGSQPDGHTMGGRGV